MATGRSNQLAKQVGEYLVAAEICRRGFIATTFTGNVPHFDIVATNDRGDHLAIQVKASRGSGRWQFDFRTFAACSLNDNRQNVGAATKSPCKGLIVVMVQLRELGSDEFYIMTWSDLQKIAIDDYKQYLKLHRGVRPKKHDSFHTAIKPAMVACHRGRWDLLDQMLG